MGFNPEQNYRMLNEEELEQDSQVKAPFKQDLTAELALKSKLAQSRNTGAKFETTTGFIKE